MNLICFQRLKAKLEGIDHPPAWPVDLLQKLARYIHVTRKLNTDIVLSIVVSVIIVEECVLLFM
jgi:hypothetical protein